MGGSSSTQQKPSTQSSTSQTFTDKKPHIVTKTNQSQKKQSQQTPQFATEKEINTVIESITEKDNNQNKFLAQELTDIIQKELQNNPLLRQIREQKQQFNKQYIVPLKKKYDQIPSQLTAFKFTYLNRYDYKDRLIALGLLSMLVGVRSFKRALIYQLPLRTFSAAKDSAVVYFLGGLFIAPQIYNPLMDQ